MITLILLAILFFVYWTSPEGETRYSTALPCIWGTTDMRTGRSHEISPMGLGNARKWDAYATEQYKLDVDIVVRKKIRGNRMSKVMARTRAHMWARRNKAAQLLNSYYAGQIRYLQLVTGIRATGIIQDDVVQR